MIDIVALGMPCDKQTNFSYFFSALSTFYFGIRSGSPVVVAPAKLKPM